MTTPKVLIAEDDPELLRAYGRVLAADGNEILSAATGAEALAIAGTQRPDLVLLGVMLPDVSGVELCRRIKSDPEHSPFVVMISALHNSAESQAEAVEAGADGYLTEPIEPVALKAHVRAFLRIRLGEKELRESERRLRRQAEELQEANRRLEEYNRLKAEFVANMSHELRTPLTAIIGFAQLAQLKRGEGPPPDYSSEAFERILRNGQHLLALINDVLDVSKIEAGRMKIHREHVNVAEVVQEAFGELQSLAARKGLDYRLSVPERLPLAYTDPLRVRQVLMNLLSNAVKFTAAGAVEVELRPEPGDRFRLVVRDTGVGIEPDALGIIFERFRQADGSTTRVAGGAGLGLSIVRQIVELLGGEVEVESSVGEGSAFSVVLPLVAPEPAGVGAEGAGPPVFAGAQPTADGNAAAPGDEDAGGEAPLVVVIEDDQDAADLLTGSIERAGYRVRRAADGAEGLRLVRELEPVAVTLDVMMPGMDGWRVLQEMKADRKLASVPVIVCSIVDNRPLGFSLGASDYLLKPVDPERLSAVLDRVSVRSGGDEGEGYVLVVDDEHGVRELLAFSLRQAGYQVKVAPSGETALNMVAQQAPRAVLCDLMMPAGMTGFEFVARLRAEPETAHVPVVIITGKDLTRGDRHFISGQIADVIRKGELLMEDVASRLRQTLEGVGVKPTDG
ncbi:MAG TPA: response regulator [Pyrinomonadaceae bacterium]|nr:response regulator [Pyrinomonadaceae bacterium]